MSVLFCDTDCELWYTHARELNLEVIRMPYVIDGEEKLCDLGEETDTHDFYQKMRNGASASTAGLNQQIYYDTFEPFFKKGEDILWYLWTAPNSPLYGRAKMATFERYFVDDKSMHVEEKNNYYRHIDQPQIADKILKEFGLEGNDVRIINGHVPVQRVKGESPVKCEGKVIIIDGGFSKTYRKKTGIAGYTLIYNSYGLTLTAHQPFVSREKAIREELDIVSQREIVQLAEKRILVGDSDKGRKMKEKIADLKMLIEAYRSGEIVEKDS